MSGCLDAWSQRGALVPFTTPILAGSRIRRSRDGPPELVLPNPSGGRGYYVLPWGALREFCTLTLHDELLWERLQELETPDPAAVREVARQVARTGAAGRGAAKAVEEAARSRAALREQLEAELLEAFLHALDAAPEGALDRPELRRRIRLCVGDYARSAGLTVDAVLARIQAIAVALAEAGASGGGVCRRWRELAARMTRLSSELDRWRGVETGMAREAAARLAAAARQTAAAVEQRTAVIDGALRDLRSLVRDWTPGHPLAVAAREIVWLLDGWEEICWLWERAVGSGQSGRREVLLEARRMLPPPITGDGREAAMGAKEFLGAPGRLHADDDWRVHVRELDRRIERERLVAEIG